MDITQSRPTPGNPRIFLRLLFTAVHVPRVLWNPKKMHQKDVMRTRPAPPHPLLPKRGSDQVLRPTPTTALFFLWTLVWGKASESCCPPPKLSCPYFNAAHVPRVQTLQKEVRSTLPPPPPPSAQKGGPTNSPPPFLSPHSPVFFGGRWSEKKLQKSAALRVLFLCHCPRLPYQPPRPPAPPIPHPFPKPGLVLLVCHKHSISIIYTAPSDPGIPRG